MIDIFRLYLFRVFGGFRHASEEQLSDAPHLTGYRELEILFEESSVRELGESRADNTIE